MLEFDSPSFGSNPPSRAIGVSPLFSEPANLRVLAEYNHGANDESKSLLPAGNKQESLASDQIPEPLRPSRVRGRPCVDDSCETNLADESSIVIVSAPQGSEQVATEPAAAAAATGVMDELDGVEESDSFLHNPNSALDQSIESNAENNHAAESEAEDDCDQDHSEQSDNDSILSEDVGSMGPMALPLMQPPDQLKPIPGRVSTTLSRNRKHRATRSRQNAPSSSSSHQSSSALHSSSLGRLAAAVRQPQTSHENARKTQGATSNGVSSQRTKSGSSKPNFPQGPRHSGPRASSSVCNSLIKEPS